MLGNWKATPFFLVMFSEITECVELLLVTKIERQNSKGVDILSKKTEFLYTYLPTVELYFNLVSKCRSLAVVSEQKQEYTLYFKQKVTLFQVSQGL